MEGETYQQKKSDVRTPDRCYKFTPAQKGERCATNKLMEQVDDTDEVIAISKFCWICLSRASTTRPQ